MLNLTKRTHLFVGGQRKTGPYLSHVNTRWIPRRGGLEGQIGGMTEQVFGAKTAGIFAPNAFAKTQTTGSPFNY